MNAFFKLMQGAKNNKVSAVASKTEDCQGTAKTSSGPCKVDGNKEDHPKDSKRNNNKKESISKSDSKAIQRNNNKKRKEEDGLEQEEGFQKNKKRRRRSRKLREQLEGEIYDGETKCPPDGNEASSLEVENGPPDISPEESKNEKKTKRKRGRPPKSSKRSNATNIDKDEGMERLPWIISLRELYLV